MEDFKIGTSPVNIYIASINTARSTELCVRSIIRNTPRSSITINIGDCGSTDSTLPRLMKMLRKGLIDDIVIEPRGRSHGSWLDLWTNTCPTQYAAIVDSDIEILKPSWLETLISTAQDTNAAIVCAEVLDEIPNYVDYTGVPRRLARRPSAWMMLVDVEKCRGRGSWGFAMEDDQRIPEGLWGLDTGALLLRQLESDGESVVAAPDEFVRSFRHFGGLSWVKMTHSKAWRHRASLVKVRILNSYIYFRLLGLRLLSNRS